MGHSSLDTASHELRPWNQGRFIAAKRALKPQQHPSGYRPANPRRTVLTRLVARKHPPSTRRQVTCGPFRSCLGMRRLRAPSPEPRAAARTTARKRGVERRTRILVRYQAMGDRPCVSPLQSCRSQMAPLAVARSRWRSWNSIQPVVKFRSASPRAGCAVPITTRSRFHAFAGIVQAVGDSDASALVKRTLCIPHT